MPTDPAKVDVAVVKVAVKKGACVSPVESIVSFAAFEGPI